MRDDFLSTEYWCSVEGQMSKESSDVTCVERNGLWREGQGLVYIV